MLESTHNCPVAPGAFGRPFIKTPDGKIVHSEGMAYINRNLCEKGYGLKEFKVIQKTIDSLLVMVVKNDGEEKEVIKFFAEQIEKNISDKMIVSFFMNYDHLVFDEIITSNSTDFILHLNYPSATIDDREKADLSLLEGMVMAAEDYIQKPVMPDALLRRAEELLK